MRKKVKWIIKNIKRKPMQGCAKKINQNQNQKKKMMPIESILRLRCQFEGSYEKSGETYQDDILKDDSLEHKGISTALS